MTPRIGDMLRWISAGVILFGALLRMMTLESRVPWWDIDPSRAWTPEVTLTPLMQLMIDASIWIAVAMAIVGEASIGRRIMSRTGALLAIGCCAVLLHGLWLTPQTGIGAPSDVRISGSMLSLLRGSAWCAAISGAWAMMHLARDRTLRTCIVLIALGSVSMLAWKGAYQVFIEHEFQVRHYQVNKSEVLISQNLEPGSAAARIFERRLMQAEATGWFGLSNVYASFMAALFAGWLMIAVAAFNAMRTRRIGSGEFGLIAIAAIAALSGVVLARSKGGAVAALLGLLLVLFGVIAARRQRKLAPPAGFWICGLVAFPLVLVLLRGVIGERVGELSLLFRWQYMVGAVRVFLEHPVIGVGPAGFKDAYLLSRLPTSPEEVESPHSLLFDWSATLGFFALAWMALWGFMLCRAGNQLVSPHRTDLPEELPNANRPVIFLSLAVIVGLVAASMMIEWQRLTPDLMLLLPVGAIAWLLLIFVGWRTLSGEDGDARIAQATSAAAIVLCVHSQIELTMTLTGAAPLALMFLGLAAPGTGSRTGPMPRHSVRPVGPAAVFVLASLVVAGTLSAIALAKLLPWQSQLHSAAAPFRHITTLEAELAGAGPTMPAGSGQWEELALRVSELTGRPISPEPNAIRAALHEQRLRAMASAVPALRAADEMLPSIDRPLHWAARFQVESAAAQLGRGNRQAGLELLADATNDAETLVRRFPQASSAWSRVAGIYAARATLLESDSAISVAQDAWRRVLSLDPEALVPRWRLFELALQEGDPNEALRWARSALEKHAQFRLDPLKGLTEPQEAELRRLVESAGGPTAESPSE